MNIFFSKVFLGFQFWTFIFVHFSKPEKTFEKNLSKMDPKHNGHKWKLRHSFFVTIIFLFKKINIKSFFVFPIYGNFGNKKT
jgi:hypothetical protein